MNVAARVTSKGQITIPKQVREALDLHDGDSVFFAVQGNQAVLSRTPDFIDLAGSVTVTFDSKNKPISEIRKVVRTKRAKARL